MAIPLTPSTRQNTMQLFTSPTAISVYQIVAICLALLSATIVVICLPPLRK
jgi:hypothetical protein